MPKINGFGLSAALGDAVPLERDPDSCVHLLQTEQAGGARVAARVGQPPRSSRRRTSSQGPDGDEAVEGKRDALWEMGTIWQYFPCSAASPGSSQVL